MSKIALFRTKSFQLILLAVLMTGIGIAFAIDTDNDGMSDAYETFFRMDPSNALDAAQNNDADLLDNRQESLLWSDPHARDTDLDGFLDHEDSNALSRAAIDWGHAPYTSGSEYFYTGPDWWLGAGKLGGDFIASVNLWRGVKNDEASVYFDLDRARLTNNVMLDLLHRYATGTVVRIDFMDSDGAVLAADVVGNVAAGGVADKVFARHALPLADWPSATRIVLTAKSGSDPYRLWSSVLYIDEDGDGLDADQELQVGTLDSNADCDADGLNDYAEVFITKTDPLNPDTDSDLLLDGDELVYGTDPHLFDTDADQLSDGEEVHVALTDPLKMDTDGDGIGDGEERMAGLDPLSTDSDGDGIPDAVALHGRYYVVVHSPMAWDEAKADAERRGGHLATIASEEEQWRIEAITGNAFTNGVFWLGASDAGTEGTWRWVTGEPFAYSRWSTNSLNLGTNHNWLSTYPLRKGTSWTDRENKNFKYLLEYEGCTNAADADTDADGLTDYEEMALALNPFVADIDLDGLPDGQELAAGSDPFNADTDGDGLSDGEEVLLGTDPANADTDGDGLLDGAETHFEIVPFKMSWHEARDEAMRRGGHLPMVSGDDENKELRRTLLSVTDDICWLGATDEAVEQSWLWVDGEPLSYGNWDVAGNTVWPVNTFEESDYARMLPSGRWRHSGPFNRVFPAVEHGHSLDPLNPDSDGDGLSDGDEIFIHQTSPFLADTDGDTLSDGEEVAAGLQPLWADTDRDGLMDAAEASHGLDPFNPDADGDGLKDGEEILVTGTNPFAVDSNTNGIPDLVLAGSIPGSQAVETFNAVGGSWTNDGSAQVLSSVKDGAFIVFDYEAAEPGIVRFALQTRFEHPEEIEPFLEPRLFATVDGAEIGILLPNVSTNLPKYTFFSPWLTTGRHEIKLTAIGGAPEGWLAIDALESFAIDGTDADGNAIADWMEASLSQAGDTDGDGISDFDEVALHGSNPLTADSDGDGLADGAEIAAGTGILDPDSDDDGILDGDEVNEIRTNPLVAEFDGTVETVFSLTGSQTNRAVGSWEIQGAELVSKKCRGVAEYGVDFPRQDIYCLNINAAHLWKKSSCTPVVPVDTSRLQIYVDGIYVGSYPLVAADGVYADVRAFLPVLPAGAHTVRIFWENVHSRLSLKLNTIELLAFGGPDNNGNGTKDWIEASLAAVAGVDPLPAESHVSPLCIEGNARYVSMMDACGVLLDNAWSQGEEEWWLGDFPLGSLDDLREAQSNIVSQSSISNLPFETPRQGAGARWHADLPLDPIGKTTALLSFQNEALIKRIETKWVPYNLLVHDGEALVIRAGDSLKLNARPEGSLLGRFTITLDGQEICSQQSLPVIHRFDEPGTYLLGGEYKKLFQTQTGSVTVQVVGGAFPAESPACLVGRDRFWSFDGMPSNIVYEVDDSVEMQVQEVEMVQRVEMDPEGTTITNQPSLVTRVALKANDTNGDHIILARLYPNGPVLASTRLSPFWVQNATDGYFYTVERYEDSELWEVNSIVKNLPDTVDLQIKVITAGVTLDDYTLERWLTSADYDETGSYHFRLFHPNDKAGSTCHTFKLYQDGVLLGDAFSGGKDDIEE